MGTWYVRYERDDQYREVWCQADSKKEAIERADRQNDYFQTRTVEDRSTGEQVVENPAVYKRVRVEEIEVPTEEVVTEPGAAMNTETGLQEASIEAVVIRADGTREDLGTISYWHKNPLRRLRWRLKHRSN